MYICIHTYIYIYIYTYIHIYIYIYVCVCICMYVWGQDLSACMYACMHASVYACVCICMYASIYVCMHACMCVRMYVCMWFICASSHHSTGVPIYVISTGVPIHLIWISAGCLGSVVILASRVETHMLQTSVQRRRVTDSSEMIHRWVTDAVSEAWLFSVLAWRPIFEASVRVSL